MVMDPAADATVWQMFASSGLNGTSGRSAAKNPIEMAAERTLPPCAQPALSPKLTFMALTTNPTKTPASTARALRGSASRDTIAPPAELWRVRFFRDEENKSRARITTWSVPLTPRRDRRPLARSVLCQGGGVLVAISGRRIDARARRASRSSRRRCRDARLENVRAPRPPRRIPPRRIRRLRPRTRPGGHPRDDPHWLGGRGRRRTRATRPSAPADADADASPEKTRTCLRMTVSTALAGYQAGHKGAHVKYVRDQTRCGVHVQDGSARPLRRGGGVAVTSTDTRDTDDGTGTGTGTGNPDRRQRRPVRCWRRMTESQRRAPAPPATIGARAQRM